MSGRCRAVETLSADDLLELDDLPPAVPGEPEEMTVRRFFEPKTPPKVAVEVSDADATWKWQRPRADQQGQFTGVALPILDGESALQFDPSEVEVTTEMQSPFALQNKASLSAIPLARRRNQPPRRPVFVADITAETAPFRGRSSSTRLLAVALAMVLVAGLSAFLVRSRMPRIAAVGVAMRTLVEQTAESAPAALVEPIAPAKTTGTMTATVKGVRVWVDGKLAGDSSQSLTVSCGSHVVKVGSSGVDRMVVVPCGGDVSIAP